MRSSCRKLLRRLKTDILERPQFAEKPGTFHWMVPLALAGIFAPLTHGNTETYRFEDIANNGTTFVSSGQTFTLTNFMVGQIIAGYGSNPDGGTGPSDGYMDSGFNVSRTGNVGGIQAPTGYYFRARSIDVWPSESAGGTVLAPPVTINLIGKRDGATVLTDSATAVSYGQNPEPVGGAWLRVDLTGTDFPFTDIDTLEFEMSGDLDYIAVDNFAYHAFGTNASTPVIGTTTFDSLASGVRSTTAGEDSPDKTIVPLVAKDIAGWDFEVTTNNPGSVGITVAGSGDKPVQIGAIGAGGPKAITVRANDRSNFDLTSVVATALFNSTSGSPVDITVTGYLEGSPVAGATETITGVNRVSGTVSADQTFNLSGISAFNNVDAFALTFANNPDGSLANFRVDDITIGPASTGPTDTTAPVATFSLSGSPTASASAITYAISFDESVSNVDESDFSLLTTGSASGTIGTPSASSGTSVNVNISSISGSGTLQLVLAGSNNISDASGNQPATTAAPPQIHSVDRDAPSGFTVDLPAGPINDQHSGTVDFTVNGAEIGATLDYSLTSNGGGTPITGNLTVASNTVNGPSLNAALLPDGTLTLSVTLTDTSGNTSSAQTDTILKDTVTAAPSLASIASDSTLSSTSVTLNYSLPESPSSGSVQLTFTPSGSGSAIELTLSDTQIAFSTLDLDDLVASSVVDAATASSLPEGNYSIELSYQDSVGNAAASVTRSNVTVEARVPVVLNILRGDPLDETVSASVVEFRVEFSEPVTLIDAADFRLTGTAVTGSGSTAQIVEIRTEASGSGGSATTDDVWIVRVGNLNLEGTLNLEVSL
jgi:hypothetical protein